ncbi:MAG: hypothetical protein KDB27_17560 [Planctomycetales bacterium]|nr:hypothetical protein [Planctomycetales bacterium]
MQCVEQDIVEAALTTTAKLDPDCAAEAMMAFANSQPDIFAFEMAFTEELRDEVREIMIYLLFVVYRAFEMTATEPIPKIDSDDIVATYEENQEFVVGLDEHDESSFEQLAQSETANQPNLFVYITEALVDENSEDDIELDDQEFGEIFMILKTVIDVVDAATN